MNDEHESQSQTDGERLFTIQDVKGKVKHRNNENRLIAALRPFMEMKR